jgi:hypothetical protein
MRTRRYSLRVRQGHWQNLVIDIESRLFHRLTQGGLLMSYEFGVVIFPKLMHVHCDISLSW